MVVISVSLNPEELREFDDMVKHFGYDSRSSAIRDAIYRFNSQHKMDFKGHFDAVITLVYDADAKQDQVHNIVHDYQGIIQTSLHNHREQRCFDVLIVSGEGTKIHDLVDSLTRIKDVRVNISAT